MTGPVTTEARVEGLRTAHLAAIDACLRASETTGEVPQGLRLREREAAAALISTLLAALQQVTAERDEAREKIERLSFADETGAVWRPVPGWTYFGVCRQISTATSELARLRAEGEAKDRALQDALKAAIRAWSAKLHIPVTRMMSRELRSEFSTALARAATAREGA